MTSPACSAAQRRLAIVLLSLAIATLAGRTGVTEEPGQLSKDVIVFGGDATYAPFEWNDGAGAKGFNVELQIAIAEAGGKTAQHRLGNWPEIVDALENGSIDAVAMFRSSGREDRFRFTRPFEIEHHAIFGAPDAPEIASVEELEEFRVAVEGRSYAHDRFVESGLAVDLVLASNTVDALNSVAEGRSDYAILAETAARYLIDARGYRLRATGPPLWPTEYALAVRKDRPELAQWLDDNLRQVVESGRFQVIASRWSEDLAGPVDAPDDELLVLAAIGLLAAAALATWRSRRLRRSLNEAHSRLAWAETHYSETGLPKAQHFSEFAQRSLDSTDSGRQKQVVALRLAGYDRTNQAHGDEAARNKTREFAERLEAAGFLACGQLGRQTFVVFGDRKKIAKELRPLHDTGDTISMKIPLPRIVAGAASYPQHGESIADLLRRAEIALAHALKSGGGWTDFRPFMEPRQDDEALLALFRARGGDAVHAVFQPQIDLKSGLVIGAEALARWDAPGIGSVSPGRFVPLLEDAGLTRHLTRRMISEAMRVSKMLRDKRLSCPISVNITGDDLLGWKLSRHIGRAIEESSGKATDLKLELTETSVVDKPRVLQWKMRRLTRKGIVVSIDDFGTGYASFAYLSKFPVSEVKIDQSFIQGMGKSDKDMQIVKSTIEMGHQLGLVVVAEGVETEEGLELLRQLGCDRAQGFVISRPLPVPDFLSFAEERAATLARTTRGKIAPFRRIEA